VAVGVGERVAVAVAVAVGVDVVVGVSVAESVPNRKVKAAGRSTYRRAIALLSHRAWADREQPGEEAVA
jgi:hypothetical protein